jgi:hypothetical protein
MYRCRNHASLPFLISHFVNRRKTEKTKSPISLLSPVLVPVSARITKNPRLVARGLKSSLCFLQPAGSTSGKHNTGKGQESISGQSNQADGEKGILHNFLLLFSNYYRNPLERQIGVFFRIAGA